MTLIRKKTEQNSGTKHSFIDLCPLLLLCLHVQELSFFFDLNCAAYKVQLELPRSVLFSQEQMRRKTLSIASVVQCVRAVRFVSVFLYLHIKISINKTSCAVFH